MPLPTSTLIAAHFPLGLTLGAVYVGATIAAVYAFVPSRLPSNTHVAVLWILDTLHVILTTHALYFYMVESFGDYSALFSIICLIQLTGRSFPLQLLVGMLIVVGVQALYAVRIWKLGRSIHMVIPWFIFLAVAASLCETSFVIMSEDLNGTSKAPGSMLSMIRMDDLSYFCSSPMLTVTRYTLTTPFGIPTISTFIYVFFATLAGADFCIASTMCYYLDKGTSMNFSSACSLLTLVAVMACQSLILLVFIFHTVHGLAEDSDFHRNPFHSTKTSRASDAVRTILARPGSIILNKGWNQIEDVVCGEALNYSG
ncbi:hypothetical protein IW262DRAFT_1297704 [Armillaria fumosa]|nr:hypothetical protein IW262DRAFT_1297704 [Armillaria fumosa]